MSTKKELVLTIAEKQADIESLAARLEGERRDVDDLNGFLANLLTLEPSLKKYQSKENGWGHRDWDFDGVKRAIAFREEQANAKKYTPKEKR